MRVNSAIDLRTARIEALALRAETFEDNQLLLSLYNAITSEGVSTITFEDESMSQEFTVGGTESG